VIFYFTENYNHTFIRTDTEFSAQELVYVININVLLLQANVN